MGGSRYVRALRFRRLTGLYDPIVRLTSRESEFKERLLEQASLQPGQRVLDLGCGTGTLAIQAKRRQPLAEVAGLDGDRDVLDRAREKARQEGVDVGFDAGLSTDLAYEDDSFDVILATLFFHHLSDADKATTAREIARVLRPGGALHVADWGQPSDPVMRLASVPVRLLDGLEQTRANVRGELPAIFAAAGLGSAAETARLRTMFGTLALYRAELLAQARSH